MRDFSLQEIAQLIGGELVASDSEVIVRGAVSASSTRVTPRGLFVAVRGHAADGHSFVQDAFERGCGAAVVEDSSALAGRPGIVVARSRLALSKLASIFYGSPSARMGVVGVTGTNGKTTANWIVYHALNRLGAGAVRIGTLGTEYMGHSAREGELTSPDPVSIHAILDEALQAGATTCVMETSSHALDQARVEDVQFDICIFTNLSRDHLDYHHTFEDYFLAKRHLFELLANGQKETKGAVIYLDDPHGARLWEECIAWGLRDLSFGRDERAQFRILSSRESPKGMELTLAIRNPGRTVTVDAPFIGSHNAENITAALAAVVGLGYSIEAGIEAIRATPQVPGRLERVGESGPRVFVDYAHTPDALQRVLEAVRPSTTGKLWCLFGCGGDRDRGKRPLMGTIGGMYADHVVVTSDNPRTEDPLAIIQEILSSGLAPAITEVDRARAIARVVQEAGQEDTILIAGKGHENYQIVGTTKTPFSDQEHARRALESRAR